MRDQVLGAFAGPGVSPDPAARHNRWPTEDIGRDGAVLKAAAVLVPLVNRTGGMTVLLTRRTDTLRDHAGQISFPGGRKQASDGSPEETALRETEEETGLAADRIEIAGRMNAHDTGTGYRVMPVVGLIAPPLNVVPAPGEVAEVFEVPLGFVLDPANHRFETRIHNGSEQQFAVIPYQDRYIWGLTARLLKELSEVLRR
jgi:8-oxo-dGTP pyrophosphatase MutT (NUDIX family)